jgi:hypothetical protein
MISYMRGHFGGEHIMNKLVLDPVLRSKLNLAGEIELCDEDGRTIGFFLPAAWHRVLLYAWAKAKVSDQELDQARRQPGGRPLSEILAHLEKS